MYQRHTYPAADANVQGSAILGAALGNGVAAMAQQRQPQVMASLERMRSCIDDLNSAMGALKARIDPVLRPVEPAKEGANGCVPEPARCMVADCIEMDADRILAISAALRDMASRLEV